MYLIFLGKHPFINMLLQIPKDSYSSKGKLYILLLFAGVLALVFADFVPAFFFLIWQCYRQTLHMDVFLLKIECKIQLSFCNIWLYKFSYKQVKKKSSSSFSALFGTSRYLLQCDHFDFFYYCLVIIILFKITCVMYPSKRSIFLKTPFCFTICTYYLWVYQ